MNFMAIVIKLRESNYQCDTTFLADLQAAKEGNKDAEHQIWVKMVSKVKGVSDDLGLAYSAFHKAMVSYNMKRPLKPNKFHRWQFAAFASQRIRAAKQEERNLLKYPVRVNQRVFYYNKDRLPVPGCVDPDIILQNESGRWADPTAYVA